MQAKKSRQERNLCLVAENFTVSEAASQEVCKFCHLVSMPAVTHSPRSTTLCHRGSGSPSPQEPLRSPGPSTRICQVPLTRLVRQLRRWFGWQNRPHSTGASRTSSDAADISACCPQRPPVRANPCRAYQAENRSLLSHPLSPLFAPSSNGRVELEATRKCRGAKRGSKSERGWLR
jgi:hypothetical protein